MALLLCRCVPLSNTNEYSVESYAARASATMQPVCKAMMAYGDAANAYLAG